MAVVNVYEVTPLIERLLIIDPTAVEDQNIYNKTGEIMDLTFVKDYVSGGRTILVPDNTVPLGSIRPGGNLTVTAQQINDAIAAGNHSDIYIFSKREGEITSIPKKSVVVGGVTQPGAKKKK